MKRALIVRKQWIDLILSGEKTWEMRSKPTSNKGWIGLIEAGTGLIVGKAFLVSGHEKPSMDDLICNSDKHRVEDMPLLDKWRYVWQLEQAERFKVPIPYNHPRGAVIWVRLEDQVVQTSYPPL